MSEPVPFANLPRGLAPFGYRDFTWYWIGIATTNSGRWIELTGLLWLVYELTDSPLLVGFLGAARALPALTLSPLAGVISDRLDQRRLLSVMQAVGIVLSLALAGLVASGAVELWHIYAQVILQTAVNSFDASARQALYPRLVPRSVLSRAVTLNITAGRLSKFVGPATAGFLIAGLGVSAPLFVNAASFLVMIIAMARLRPLAPLANLSGASLGKDLLEGFNHILAAPVLRGILLLEIAFSLFEMNPAMIAIIGREILNVGPSSLGVLLSAPALGAFIGIGWLLFSQRMRRPGRLSLLCMLVYACVVAFLSFSPAYAAAFVALSVIGSLEVFVTATRTIIMQLATPANLRGRVMANIGTITRGTGPLAETQSGVLASVVGPTSALLVAAAAVAVAASLTGLINRDVWRYSLDESEPS